jgi:hypothetical protein
MYQNWRLHRWSTPMGDAEYLRMESLTDNGRLVIVLQDLGTNQNYRVTFKNYPAYRNIMEEHRGTLWTKRPEISEPDATGWTLLVEGSDLVSELMPGIEAYFDVNRLKHYLIITADDVIEVLSDTEPTIETVGNSQSLSCLP